MSKVTELAGARAVPETRIGVDSWVCRLNPEVCVAPSTASGFLLHEIKKADDLHLKPHYQHKVSYVVVVYCL